MTNLDQKELIQTLDKADMAGYILSLPSQINETFEKVSALDLPNDWSSIKNICFMGMGGSATAGSLISNLPELDLKIPMMVIRDYTLPNWINSETLVIFVSHSGSTEETISAFKYAAAKEAKIFIVAERGFLEQLGTSEGALVFDYDTPSSPRAALGYQFGALFGLLKKLNLINYNIQAVIDILVQLNQELNPKVPAEKNLAKSLAYFCFDHLPIIVSSGILNSVAWRWKTQFNENAKSFAFTENLPECMHNAIEGLDNPNRFQDDFVYLILTNSFDNQELINKTDKFRQILEEKNIAYELVEANGEDVISQKFSLVILGDWLSYYLALLNNVDPTPVKTIETAKK